MKRLIFLSFMLMILLSFSSFASAKGLELSFFLGMKDGSESSDGVIVSFTVEEQGKATNVFEQLWSKQKWSDQFIVDLNKWAGKTITLMLITDPGKARNTGWDWILIGDAKITSDGKLVSDIGQVVADVKAKLSILADGDKNETAGLKFDANCTPDAGPSGKAEKPKTFMQHPPWNGKVGNTISRFDINLPTVAGTTAVHVVGKSVTTWGQLKAQ